MRFGTLAVVVLLFGCDGCGSGTETESGSTSSASSAGSETPEEAPAAERSKRHDVHVSVTPAESAAGFVISVQNHDPETAAVHQGLIIERLNGDSGEAIDAELSLRPDCETDPPDCIELASGGELLPPSWSAELGAAQCGCEDCEPAVAGRYRIVVQSCDEQHRFESAPFNLE